MPDNKARIKHLIKYMEYDYLTDAEHDLVVSFEEQFENKGALSDKQLQIDDGKDYEFEKEGEEKLISGEFSICVDIKPASLNEMQNIIRVG